MSVVKSVYILNFGNEVEGKYVTLELTIKRTPAKI